MASRRSDDGQLLLLAGVLLVISYIMFSTQASLVATLGQQSGREASNAVVADHIALREALQVTLVREHTPGDDPLCPALQVAAFQKRAEAILQNIKIAEGRRGLLFIGTVGTVSINVDGDYLYPITMSLTNGETRITETAIFTVVCP